MSALTLEDLFQAPPPQIVHAFVETLLQPDQLEQLRALYMPALSMAEQFDAAFWLSCALLEYTELKVPGFKELSGPNPFAVIDA